MSQSNFHVVSNPVMAFGLLRCTAPRCEGSVATLQSVSLATEQDEALAWVDCEEVSGSPTAAALSPGIPCEGPPVVELGGTCTGCQGTVMATLTWREDGAVEWRMSTDEENSNEHVVSQLGSTTVATVLPKLSA